MVDHNAVRFACRTRGVQDVSYSIRRYAFAKIAIFETGKVERRRIYDADVLRRAGRNAVTSAA